MDAKFVMIGISLIYELIKKSTEDNYSIFDTNIREYLGNNNINKKMTNTLADEDDRKNFFYYNNGITIVCEDFEGHTNKFKVSNPQIVNGCQTSFTIYNSLKDSNNPEEEFKESFVMVKLLKVEKDNKILKNIVLYNNSQNKVDEKDLEAIKKEFIRMQQEFKNHGLLLNLKQSDKNTNKENAKNDELFIPNNIKKNTVIFKKLLNPKKLTDILVDIEKVLQILLCYEYGADKAYKDKAKLLRKGSSTNLNVNKLITSSTYTFKDIINLWTLFKYLELKKPFDTDIPTIPFYIITCIKQYTTLNNKNSLNKILACKKDLDFLITFYKKVTDKYKELTNFEANTMIKSKLKYDLLKKAFKELAKYDDNFKEINERYKPN